METEALDKMYTARERRGQAPPLVHKACRTPLIRELRAKTLAKIHWRQQRLFASANRVRTGVRHVNSLMLFLQHEHGVDRYRYRAVLSFPIGRQLWGRHGRTVAHG